MANSATSLGTIQQILVEQPKLVTTFSSSNQVISKEDLDAFRTRETTFNLMTDSQLITCVRSVALAVSSIEPAHSTLLHGHEKRYSFENMSPGGKKAFLRDLRELAGIANTLSETSTVENFSASVKERGSDQLKKFLHCYTTSELSFILLTSRILTSSLVQEDSLLSSKELSEVLNTAMTARYENKLQSHALSTRALALIDNSVAYANELKDAQNTKKLESLSGFVSFAEKNDSCKNFSSQYLAALRSGKGNNVTSLENTIFDLVQKEFNDQGNPIFTKREVVLMLSLGSEKLKQILESNNYITRSQFFGKQPAAQSPNAWNTLNTLLMENHSSSSALSNHLKALTKDEIKYNHNPKVNYVEKIQNIKRIVETLKQDKTELDAIANEDDFIPFIETMDDKLQLTSANEPSCTKEELEAIVKNPDAFIASAQELGLLDDTFIAGDNQALNEKQWNALFKLFELKIAEDELNKNENLKTNLDNQIASIKASLTVIETDIRTQELNFFSSNKNTLIADQEYLNEELALLYQGRTALDNDRINAFGDDAERGKEALFIKRMLARRSLKVATETFEQASNQLHLSPKNAELKLCVANLSQICSQKGANLSELKKTVPTPMGVQTPAGSLIEARIKFDKAQVEFNNANTAYKHLAEISSAPTNLKDAVTAIKQAINDAATPEPATAGKSPTEAVEASKRIADLIQEAAGLDPSNKEAQEAAAMAKKVFTAAQAAAAQAGATVKTIYDAIDEAAKPPVPSLMNRVVPHLGTIFGTVALGAGLTLAGAPEILLGAYLLARASQKLASSAQNFFATKDVKGKAVNAALSVANAPSQMIASADRQTLQNTAVVAMYLAMKLWT